MATSIISAGDAANLGVQTTGGDDGVLVLRSGAAGAKVDALSIAAVGTGAFVGEVTATGFTGTLDGVLGGGTPAAATVTTFTSNGIDDNADAVAITIDSSENVGIGTASPGTKLSVVSGTNAGISVNDGTVNTILYNSTGPTGSVGTTTNHPMAFYANNEIRMLITGAGNVGIGKSPLDKPLEVYAATNPALRIQNSATGTGSNDGLLIEQNGVDSLLVNYEAGIMKFATSNVVRMSILAAGGLTFNNDTAADNALDDYEYGTFTPNVLNTGSTSTWSAKNGQYLKVGSLVNVWVKCDGGNSGTAGSVLQLTGLPFTNNNSDSVMATGIWGANSTTARTGNMLLNTNNLYTGGSAVTEQATFVAIQMTYYTTA